jgi:4-hydroxy-4-methyl-2-oxoglutarate aldolase
VIACHGNMHQAMWGGLMTALSQIAGIAGAIVDGAVRDVDEMRDLNFPAWYRGTMPRRCPATAGAAADPVQVNVPVRVGGQIIEPGDIVVADENGIAIVPIAVAQEVLHGTADLLAAEKLIRGRVDAGATVAQLLTEFSHL